MSEAKKGDTVRVHYTGKLKEGEVFDSSRQREPIKLTLGSGDLIAGFENAIEGMLPGQSKSVQVPADEGYGQRHDDRILEIDRNKLPPGTVPQVGQRIELQSRDGHAIPAYVIRVSSSTVTVDANHPLAGRDLVFDLELVEIV